MTEFRRLSPTMLVAGQIAPDDVEAAKNQGVGLIVNNRPDGEEPEAPQSDEIEAAARAAGLDYLYVPVTHAGFSGAQIDSLVNAIGTSGKPVLAYCRSGMRSTCLWALAQVKQGSTADEVIAAANGAGYDISGIRPLMDIVAGD